MSVTLTDSNGCLKTGMRADILRTSFETKNVLLEKGAIHMGMGSTISISSEDGKIDIYKTSSVPCGGNNDTVLTFNSTGISPLGYQKIGPDTVIKKETYNIKVDETEETLSADYAEVADYVTWATAPSGRNPISIEARLSDLNSKVVAQGAQMNLSCAGAVVGWVQISSGSQLGNYKEVNLSLHLSNTINLFPFYRGDTRVEDSQTITGRLWTGSSTHDFPESITGFFPSCLITGFSHTDGLPPFKQKLALKYTILNNGTITITCPHPFPGLVRQTETFDIRIMLRFRMPDAN